MIKGFRDFIMRSNVVELAIAVVIGTAFAALVNVFVTAIVKPVISAFPGASVNGWGFHLRGGELGKPTFIDLSAIINAVVVFLITAAVVYFIFVVPMTTLQQRRARHDTGARGGAGGDPPAASDPGCSRRPSDGRQRRVDAAASARLAALHESPPRPCAAVGCPIPGFRYTAACPGGASSGPPQGQQSAVHA